MIIIYNKKVNQIVYKLIISLKSPIFSPCYLQISLPEHAQVDIENQVTTSETEVVALNAKLLPPGFLDTFVSHQIIFSATHSQV